MKVQVGVELSFVNCDGLFSTFHHIRYTEILVRIVLGFEAKGMTNAAFD